MNWLNFSDFVEKWRQDARIGIGDGWKICQDAILRLHIVPHLGCLEIENITPSDISTVINASVNRGHSPNQTKKIYMVMSKIFKDAVEFFEVINKSPVKKRFHLPKVPDIKRPHMTPLESWTLLEYVMGDEQYGVAVWLQLLSGLRVSEVQGLHWEDVDFEKSTIFIQRCFNKHTKKMQPFTKNRSQYRVPMPPALAKQLLKIKKPSGFVCTHKNGGMFGLEGYKIFLKKVCFRLNLPISSSHGLRHSCSALYASEGASDESLQALLGHKTIASLKTYRHRDDKELWEIAKKIS